MPRAQGASKKETFEMGPFKYFKGKLFAEGVSIANLAEEIGTPFYCYSSAMLEKQYHMFASAVQSLDMEICYAVKANSNIAVIRTLARLGAGADVVSVGEFKRAIVAGKQVEFFITATTPEITTKGFKEKGRITPIFTTPEILRATGMGNKCIPTQKQFEKFQELLGQAQEALYA